METFLYYCLKAGLVLIWFWIIYRLFLQKETFYRFNRFFLLTGMVTALLLPLYTVHYTVEILPAEMMVYTTTETDAETNRVAAAMYIANESGLINHFDHGTESVAAVEKKSVLTALFRNGLPVVYITGALVLLLFRLFGVFRLVRIIRKNKKQPSTHYCLIESTDIQNPFSFFRFVFLPAHLSKQEKAIILKHEATHIRQKHRIDLLFSELLAMFWWFNPIIWIYGKIVRNNHEYLADEAVLKEYDSLTYRQTLVNQWVKATVFPLANSFSYANQVKRINMMKKYNSNPTKQLLSLFILPGICLILASFAEPHYVIATPKPEIISAESELATVEPMVTPLMQTITGQVETDLQNTNLTSTNQTSKKQVPDEKSSMNVDDKNTIVPSPPTIIIDDKKVNQQQLDKLQPENIASFTVLKDSTAAKDYGEEAKNGVILVETKSSSEKTHLMDMNEPLIIIDDEKASTDQLSRLSIDNIESFFVIKDSTTIKSYGEEAKNGVILITTKKPNTLTFIHQLKDARKSYYTTCPEIASPHKEIWLVDGKRIENLEDTTFLHTNDIHSFSVLKDKSIIDQFAQEGAHRVIHITTKKGWEKKMKTDNNEYTGIVTDAKGNPIKEAQISFFGRNDLVKTNKKGKFSFHAVPGEYFAIEHNKYNRKLIQIKEDNPETFLRITLDK